MSRLWTFFLLVIRKFRRKGQPKDQPTVADIYAAGLVPPPEVQAETSLALQSERKINRKQRRAESAEVRRLRRARLKFDKFVEPKGPSPVSHERGVSDQPKPKPSSVDGVVPLDEDKHMFYVTDSHHSDDKTEVLYEYDELYGEFNFRDTILEQLDSYFMYLHRMKRHDPDSFALYRKVGALLLPYGGTLLNERAHCDEEQKLLYKKPFGLSSWFIQTRPSFGCFAYAANSYGEKLEERKLPGKKQPWIAKFMYFQKYSKPPLSFKDQQQHKLLVEPIRKDGGDFYLMTVWWDRPQDKKIKYGAPQSYPICVDRDGRVWPLRMLETRLLPIHNKKYYKKHGIDYVPQRAWRFPNYAKEWATQYDATVEQFVGHIFCDAVRRIELASYSMAKVSVEKDGEYAMFAIDAHRIPYFFQDRDYKLNEKGRRKRIFHAVRPHIRSDGTAVPMTFRGLSEFPWAGYNVKITIPGLDHRVLEELDMGVSSLEPPEKGDVTMGELGKRLRSHLGGKPFRQALMGKK